MNGPPVDADIIGSDRENVYVQTNAGTSAIPRREISDVDHPGDTAIGLGAALIGYGILNIAVGAKDCQKHEGGEAYCAGVYAPAVLGAGLFGWGILIHAGSAQSLDTPVRGRGQTAATRWVVAPAIAPETRTGAVAIGAQF